MQQMESFGDALEASMVASRPVRFKARPLRVAGAHLHSEAPHKKNENAESLPPWQHERLP